MFWLEFYGGQSCKAVGALKCVLLSLNPPTVAEPHFTLDCGAVCVCDTPQGPWLIGQICTAGAKAHAQQET